MSPWSLLLSTLLSTFIACFAYAEPIRVAGYFKAPYMMEVEPQTGLCFDILREVSVRSGHQISYSLLPNRRLIDFFQNKKIDAEPCVSPIWRAKDDNISVYSQPFYQTENIVLIKKADQPILNDIQYFSGKTLGAGQGYIYSDGFQEAFTVGKIFREDTRTAEQNIRKLHLDRIDGVLIDRLTAVHWINKLGYDATEFSIAYVFKTKSILSIRLNKDFETVIPAFNQALQSMQEDGTTSAIIVKYTIFE